MLDQAAIEKIYRLTRISSRLPEEEQIRLKEEQAKRLALKELEEKKAKEAKERKEEKDVKDIKEEKEAKDAKDVKEAKETGEAKKTLPKEKASQIKAESKRV